MSQVDLERVQSTRTDPGEIASDLVGQLSGAEPALCIVWAYPECDHETLARKLSDALPGHTRLLYVTSDAPIGLGGAVHGAVVLAALSGDLEVGLGFGRSLEEEPVEAGSQAAASAASELGISPTDINTRNTFGLVIDDALRQKKEEFLLGILDKNPAISLVGGGAGDGRLTKPDTSRTVVGVDGKVAENAGVVALVRTNAKWKTFRHFAYKPTGQSLKVSKVDDDYLQAIEIDGKPAAQRYAELVGVDIGELDYPGLNGFWRYPTAMRVGREHFVCAPLSTLPEGKIAFANRILPDTELEIMKLDDVVPALNSFLEKELPEVLGAPSCALYFNCYARYMMSQVMGIEQEVDVAYGKGPKSAGMNAQFEIFNGFQVNSTLTAVAFGRGT